jgi:uncharacterized membrane protein
MKFTALKRIVDYLHTLTIGASKESSKRFMSLFIIILLVTYVVVRYTDKDNMHLVLAELLFFVAALVGVATYETIQIKKTDKKDEIEI